MTDSDMARKIGGLEAKVSALPELSQAHNTLAGRVLQLEALKRFIYFIFGVLVLSTGLLTWWINSLKSGASDASAIIKAINTTKTAALGAIDSKTSEILNTRLFAPGVIISYLGELEAATEQAFRDRGWLLCDGKEYDSNTKPELGKLYEKIKASQRFKNDGVFLVPDLRGRFLRGIDTRAPERSNDLGSSERRHPISGELSLVPGSIQRESVHIPDNVNAVGGGLHGHEVTGGPHSHDVSDNAPHHHTLLQDVHHGRDPGSTNGWEGGNANNDRVHSPKTSPEPGHKHVISKGDHTHNISDTGTHGHTVTGGGAETRPSNLAVHFFIRF